MPVGKKGYIIVTLLLIFFVYLVLPLKVYSRSMHLSSLGASTIKECFYVPPLKTRLRIRISIKLVGIINITISDPMGDRVFAWQEVSLREERLTIDKTVNVRGHHEYIILYEFFMSECDVEITLTTYTFEF